MPVKRRTGKERAPEVSDLAWSLMRDEPLPSSLVEGNWEMFLLTSWDGDELPNGSLTLLGHWRHHGPDIVEQWIADHPGTRPSCWWCWEAPRIDANQPLPYRMFGERNTAPRLRLGGTGTAKKWGEVHLGMPTRWTTREDVALGAGTGRNIFGEPITFQASTGDCAVAIDPSDPPTHESQAAYLARHNLLQPGERRRLKPVDFAPDLLDVRGYLETIAVGKETARLERIKKGNWQGEPAGWDCVDGPFVVRKPR